MTEKKDKNKGGRPKKIIDYTMVEKLASLMCTQIEIAEFLDLSVRTLQRDDEFCRIYKKGIEKGKMSLRRMQWKHAERNPAMAIFLGKNYLGQTDKQDISATLATTYEEVKKQKEKYKKKD